MDAQIPRVVVGDHGEQTDDISFWDAEHGGQLSAILKVVEDGLAKRGHVSDGDVRQSNRFGIAQNRGLGSGVHAPPFRARAWAISFKRESSFTGTVSPRINTKSMRAAGGATIHQV